MIERLRSKQRFVASYTRLASRPQDKWALSKLAWRRFDVFEKRNRESDKHWSARLRCLDDKVVHLRLTDVCHLAIFDELFLHSAYDLGLVSFTPDFILDVGAHIGLFSLLAATRWPQAPILAFEPHPDNAAWARLNLSSNKLRATLIEAAASSQAGWSHFSLGEGMGQIASSGDVSVPTVDLPAFIKTFPIQRLLLKMDIEGEELSLLPNVLPVLPADCAVFVELHGSRQQCQTLLEKADSMGFDHQTINDRQSPGQDQHFMDTFLTRR